MKPFKKQLQSDSICVVGIPLDNHSSFRKGSSLAPDRIRESYFSDASNFWSETGIDLEAIDHLFDLGDIEFSKTTDEFHIISETIKKALKKNCRIISLGGDHSITFPVVKAFAQIYDSLNILHFDAHPDLYDILDGDIHSHACPFARIMEAGLAKRLVQVGIRAMTGHQRDQAQRFGVEVLEMKDRPCWPDSLKFEGPVYLSIDMDCLDPGFAPGVSHHEPGGMTTRELIHHIQHLKGRLIGADIVEYNPDRDIGSMTAVVAAKLLKEIIARMHQNGL